ncbi:MAG: hypothetical protein R3D28_11100 [Geminicoccaceae bacterium]
MLVAVLTGVRTEPAVWDPALAGLLAAGLLDHEGQARAVDSARTRPAAAPGAA